jgi:hypothetical protein
MNPWITNSFLDSCAFDPKYHPEDQAATELFRLHQTEHLGILLAHSPQKKVDHPNTPAWVKTKAAGLSDSMFVANMRWLGELSTAKRLPGAGLDE